MAKSNYHCGIDNEKRVKRLLKRMGAEKVIQSPGSRGSYDLEAIFPTGKKWLVQVKSSCEGNLPKKLNTQETKRLVNDSKKKNGTAIYANVTDKHIGLAYVVSKKKIK